MNLSDIIKNILAGKIDPKAFATAVATDLKAFGPLVKPLEDWALAQLDAYLARHMNPTWAAILSAAVKAELEGVPVENNPAGNNPGPPTYSESNPNQ